METIGDRLLDARQRKFLTQEALATIADVGEITISRIERNDFKRLPTHRTLSRLANALEVDLDWLAFGDDSGKAAA